MEAPEISVYGEAKSEYTHQLCVFLVPTLESYFLNLLQQAKDQAPTPDLTILKFQESLESIPDWNQDKVQRETEKIQKDCSCDYLEELLTAVFIAHTKVLSAIRLTTKQKKLQITIPKLEHFLHRVLSDCARSLWTNSFLFESSCLREKNSIVIQKDLRTVAKLLKEAVLQAIRGLLPVKSILREYLHDDEEEGQEKEKEKEKDKEESTVTDQTAEVSEESEVTEATSVSEQPIVPPPSPAPPKAAETATENESPETLSAAPAPVPVPVPAEQSPEQPPMIFIDTKPSVTFSNDHVFFDSDNLESNEIANIPFAEEEEQEESDRINITDEKLPMEADEVLA